MERTARAPSRHRVVGIALVFLFAAPLLAFARSANTERPHCGGRDATIASNEGTIHGTRGPDVIVGGPGPNVVIGGRGNDVICAGRGPDTVEGDRGNDTIDGKRGNDTVHGGRGSDEVAGGTDRDRVFGESGNDTVRGGPGARDETDGGPGDDDVRGGRGALDAVLGGVGRDRIDGGSGRHDIASYGGTGGPIAVDLGSGAVVGAEEERLVRIEDVLGGSAGDTLIAAASTANRLDGGPGDDHLLARRDGDRAFGGPGNDQCSGAFVAEDSCGLSVSRRRGTKIELYESITGSSSLTIAGDDRVDDVTVSRGRLGYTVRGGAGNPVLRGGPLAGPCGSAMGLVSCSGPVTAILVSLGGGDDRLTVRGSVPAEVSVTVDAGPGVDQVHSGRGNDIVYAGDDADPDSILGGGGDDVLFGVNILHPRRSSGAAKLIGGSGDDLLVGGQPCGDLFRGGRGENDSVSFARVRNPGIVVRAAIAGWVFDPDVGRCTGSRIDRTVEKIEGSTGPDVLIGAAAADTLLGRGGADEVDGRGGSDRCIGGRGADRDRRCEYVR